MSSIGKPVARRDGPPKVRGATRYTGDVRLSGTLHGAVLRSPLPYARIVSIDADAARSLPGVHAVLTGRDIPEMLAGRSLADVPVLCCDLVRFTGDRVAAVAAETREIAERAVQRIEVQYAELEPVFDPHAAIRADAPVLHPRFLEYMGAPKQPYPLSNLCGYSVRAKGDVEVGLAESDLVVEHRFTTRTQHQGYLEPHSVVASWDSSGVLHVWVSNKAPFLLGTELARILGLPPESIVVEQTYVGGDFGGKGSAMDAPLAALLSRRAGRPVRMLMDSAQELTAGNPRHAAEVTIRTGLTRDGSIQARDISILFDGGAYAGYKPIPGGNLAAHFWSAGPYRTPHVRFESMVAYTNHLPAGHMRAPGIAQITFAEEVDMDLLAREIGVDPLTFRQRHALTDGDAGPLGEQWRSVRLMACLERVRRASDWDAPRPANVGRGVAVSHCAGGMGASSAIVRIGHDGRATLRTGVNDQGSGSHTTLLQIVAQELGLPVEDVDLVVGGTNTGPFDSGSSASRVTYVGGLAAQRAAAEARQRLVALASEYLGCAEAQVEVRDGTFRDSERADSHISFADLTRRAISPDQPLACEAQFQDMQLADTPSFAAIVAEVHVDPETGHVTVRKVTAAYDVGTVLNPIGMRGQLDGGLMQGLGMALMEEVRLGPDDGRVQTTSLADYKMPTVADIPTLEIVWITDAPGVGPFGAKAVGELTTPLLPAALSNAVFDAVGVRIVDLPITAEKIYSELVQ